MEQRIEVRGKHLFVDVRGPADAPALLYLHGGPGQGSYEFMAHQGDRLAQHLRVVGLDQRGVLRSDPLEEGETLTLAELITDCEAVRSHLGIERWAVLGQSFGGYIALLYAVAHPDRVERLLFENPGWDLGLTSRSVLRGAAELYRAAGELEQAAECTAAADDGALDTVGIWQAFTRLLNGLGERRMKLYIHQPQAAERIQQVIAAAPFPGDWWGRGGGHQRRLYDEGKLWESLIPLFPQVACPALLLKGVHDRIPSEAEVDAFLTRVPNARMVRFEESAHFIQVEEADRYTRTVVDFVLGA